MRNLLFLTFLFPVLFTACKKEKFISGNTAPNYYGVPTIKVKNYVNRMFIDLVGREPLNTEMDSIVKLLEDNNLNYATRVEIIKNIQEDTTTQSNGDNFKQLFYYNIYGQQKARFLEGAPDSELWHQYGIKKTKSVVDSLSGDMLGYQFNKQAAKVYKQVLDCDTAFRNGSIDFNEVCRRMCTNEIYDKINMNSFNYVNAVFDNTFYRFPTQDEFTAAYNMVEYNNSDLLFAQPGSNKYDMVNIAMHSSEFNDGTITWVYRAFMSRFPKTNEIYHYSLHFKLNKDIDYIIREVVKTDEYANF